VAAGVHVFEYLPGFLHAKTILSDDDLCVTGTINMDYRSFHLQFEDGVLICGAPVLEDIKRDLQAIFAISEPSPSVSSSTCVCRNACCRRFCGCLHHFFNDQQNQEEPMTQREPIRWGVLGLGQIAREFAIAVPLAVGGCWRRFTRSGQS
jgi:phosphatidylserine/phosphatidylglycerophosphate/cardiolipin synthase-like enzyme